MSDDIRHGLYLVLSCVGEALDYEAGRVETLRKAAKNAPEEGAAH